MKRRIEKIYIKTAGMPADQQVPDHTKNDIWDKKLFNNIFNFQAIFRLRKIAGNKNEQRHMKKVYANKDHFERGNLIDIVFNKMTKYNKDD